MEGAALVPWHHVHLPEEKLEYSGDLGSLSIHPGLAYIPLERSESFLKELAVDEQEAAEAELEGSNNENERMGTTAWTSNDAIVRELKLRMKQKAKERTDSI